MLRCIRHIGANAYYLHSVLHDWDDVSCLKILRNIVPAMSPGHSKVLINEYVVPDYVAAWSVTSMDWLMMALGAVKERTEKQWRALLEKVGLKVTGIWTFEQGTESLIEAEVMILNCSWLICQCIYKSKAFQSQRVQDVKILLRFAESTSADGRTCKGHYHASNGALFWHTSECPKLW